MSDVKSQKGKKSKVKSQKLKVKRQRIKDNSQMTNKKFQCKWEISRSCETLKDLRRSCEILKDLVRRSCVISITLNYNQSVCD